MSTKGVWSHLAAGAVGIGLFQLSQLDICQKFLKSERKKHVAVILSGCGVYDGSEIQESSSVLIHLDRCGADVTVFAPDIDQRHVIDHTSTQESSKLAGRKVLVEAARISRGQISPLQMLKVEQFDAVIIPGGFGVAKNLCTFAFDAEKMVVLPVVEKILKQFHANGKPIGFCCISPVLAARLFPNCQVTVGKASGDDWPYGGTVAAMIAMGADAIEVEGHEIVVDRKNKFVSAPAYMRSTTPYRVFKNIGLLVETVLNLN